MLIFILSVAQFTSICSAAYYLPGVTPVPYSLGESVRFQIGPIAIDEKRFVLILFLNTSDEQVSLKANKVMSTATPLQYDYYDLPFCRRKRSKARADNIGERLSGDSLTTSPYEVC